jgi:glutathione S-transferase
MERYHAMEWLNFISSELHKGLSAFFNPGLNAEAKTSMFAKLDTRLGFLNEHLQTHPYILGSEYSLVDAYAYNILRWTKGLKIDISKFPGILGMMEKVSQRPSVRAALEGEGLT